MQLLTYLIAFVMAAANVVRAQTPRGVFAHFMVGNTTDFTARDWSENIDKAAAAGIQAFALNVAAGTPYNERSLDLAFLAAEKAGFKLFFSFDYAGGGPWDPAVIIQYLKKWGTHVAHWQHAPGRPLVSTFEGPDHAADWINIKAQTNCFFMPDWTSVGPSAAVGLAGGVADGLFSWAAWPNGAMKMDTAHDKSFIRALRGKPYMMPVAPWFFTNLPGFNKNWVWRGGNLWYERWQQVFDLQPTYVEIISWNDFGESHYIGALDDRQYGAFRVGKAPFNYVENFEHTGWLTHLPFMIKRYVTGKAEVSRESAVVAHHVTLSTLCKGGGTTGNTASQGQREMDPGLVSPDRIYVAALLTSPASLSVSVPGNADYARIAADAWDAVPNGGKGLYYTSVPMSGPLEHTITIQRGGTVLQKLKTTVQGSCSAGDMANWNARVTSAEW